MRYVYWVLPGMLGGRPGPDCDPWDLNELWQAGFRAIVTLDSRSVDPVALRRIGFVHLRHEELDLPAIVLRTFAAQRQFADKVSALLPFIHEQVTAGRPTLVHCWAGRDRTGAVLACYLVRYEGLTAGQALARVRAARPDAMAAPGYTDAVDIFAWQEEPNDHA